MPEADQLPERLRLRVVSLVSAVLPSVTPVPATLRKVAGFAPARRARLGGQAIWEALADDGFRQRAALQVAAVPAQADDPLDAAARAWLGRDEGWLSVVEGVVAGLEESAAGIERVHGEVARLNAQVAALQAALATARAEHRGEVEEMRAEHKVLRHRLGQARSAVRDAEEQRARAVAASDAARAAAEAAVAAAEADVRRMRAQVEQAEGELTASRREGRAHRDQATVRARYLLETVIEAATGLRRELGLPAVEGTPGELVESSLETTGAAPVSSAPGTQAVLEQTLALPRARLLVDGYNVTKQAWPTASLEAQRSRLVTALGPLVARSGAETTVVFDAASAATRTVVPAPRGVKVVFSPPGVIADDVIRQLVGAEPRGRVVVAVTDDQALAKDLVRAGARVLPSAALIGLLT